MEGLSDERLVLAYREGDAASFEVLFHRYRGPLFNFLLRRVRNRASAEELYQDVWTKVIERSGEFRGDSKFATWLYRIARNACIDHTRRMKHRSHASADAASPGSAEPMIERVANPGPSTETLAEGAVLRERVARAVEALPSDQQEVFLLRQLQGLGFAEIAEVVDAPLNTVKSRMRYALERLQQELGDVT